MSGMYVILYKPGKVVRRNGAAEARKEGDLHTQKESKLGAGITSRTSGMGDRASILRERECSSLQRVRGIKPSKSTLVGPEVGSVSSNRWSSLRCGQASAMQPRVWLSSDGIQDVDVENDKVTIPKNRLHGLDG